MPGKMQKWDKLLQQFEAPFCFSIILNQISQLLIYLPFYFGEETF